MAAINLRLSGAHLFDCRGSSALVALLASTGFAIRKDADSLFKLPLRVTSRCYCDTRQIGQSVRRSLSDPVHQR